MKLLCCLALAPLLFAAGCAMTGNSAAVVRSEFIYTNAPYPECHASTIVETPSGLVAAWFGGTRERNPDVCIWVARLGANGWSTPVQVADGVVGPTNRYPTWNPVLFQPKGGPLMLFYKVGPKPAEWWGMLMTSTNDGVTWSAPCRLPEGILGPIKNKPVQLANGDILCPVSTEGSNGWRVHFERSGDLGRTWQSTPPVNDGKTIGAIQPSILFQKDGSLLAIGRTKNERIFQIASTDGGKTWGDMSLTQLPNPNSGTDAVTLRDGRQLLVYNHNTAFKDAPVSAPNNSPRKPVAKVGADAGEETGDKSESARGKNPAKGRTPLNVAVSVDGTNWQAALVLEDDPTVTVGFSYPAMIQTSDGLVHITYTWQRQRIRHVVVDPARLRPKPIVDGRWPVSIQRSQHE